MFATLPEGATKALTIVRSRPSKIEVMDCDESGNVVIPPVSHSSLVSSYRSCLLLFSVLGRAEPKLAMK